MKILDIALKYGYDTPEGFSRAFTKFHGVSPREARKGSPIRSYARLSVTFKMKGGNIMDYKIIQKPAFKVIEKRAVQRVSEDANLRTIPKFWEDCRADGTIKTLLENTSDAEMIFGICYANPHKEESTFDYSIAAIVGEDQPIPEGFTVNVIPAQAWAVFECIGAMPEAIQTLWHRICTEFFPSSAYEPTYEMDIEAYTDGDMSSPNYRSEIWVPVKMK